MTPRTLARVLAASVLAVAVAQAGPTARRSAPPAVPFDCFTSGWDASFEVVSTRFDKAAQRVTWVLKARKDGPFPAYQAFVADPDGVEAATIDVKITPAAKVKKGATLRADLSFGFLAGDPAKITIRQKR